MEQVSQPADNIQLEANWKAVLKDEFSLPYMKTLKKFLLSEKQCGKTIYPPGDEIFTAFNHAPFDKVRVVIIGQDPYHGPGQAHGLSFSVKPGVKTPPSLVNIYKELATDIEIPKPIHGCLEHWAKQGVLLLNAVLTVEQAKAASHQKKGWEQFTDRTIEVLNSSKENLVFILWGAYAEKKGRVIDRSKHHVIHSVHPSPLSAHRGFFGSKPFSKANAYLVEKNLEPIDWRVP